MCIYIYNSEKRYSDILELNYVKQAVDSEAAH